MIIYTAGSDEVEETVGGTKLFVKEWCIYKDRTSDEPDIVEAQGKKK